MKKISILFLFCVTCLTIHVNAQAPGWQWALSAGGAGSEEYGRSVFIDAGANVYTTGSFGTNTLTIGTTSLTRLGIGNVFVVKQDASGNVTWAKNFGGTSAGFGGGSGYAIHADASGNVYVAGTYYYKLVVGTTTLTALDTTAGNLGDIFVAKLDPQGNALWAVSAGGTLADAANAVSVDGSGNVFVTGAFRSRYIAFGTTTLICTNKSLPSIYTDIFIAKYNASGSLQWVKNAGTSGMDEGKGITTDGAGNVLVTGSFYAGSLTLGSTVLTGASPQNLFLLKYDTGGNCTWAKTATGSGNHAAAAVSVDGSNNVFITGSYNASTLTIGTAVVTNSTGLDFLIVKFDANGTALWAKNASYGNSLGTGVSTDGSGNSYVTGYFDGLKCAFGTTTLTNVNTGGNNTDFFVGKYDPSGTLSWVKGGGGIYTDRSNGLSVNAAGEIAITGQITTTLTLDSYTLNSGGGGLYNDILIAKIGSAVAGFKENVESSGISVFPNPNNGEFTIAIKNPLNGSTGIKIYDLMGKNIYSATLDANTTQVDLRQLRKGIYFIKLSANSGSSTSKIIID